MPIQSSVATKIVWGIRYSLVVVLAVGVRRRNPGVIVNAIVAFAASFLPGVIERSYHVRFRPWQRVYAVTALFTHAVGMLGPYDDTWWWDHLTHVHSSTILGGFAHAAARCHGRDPQVAVVLTVTVVGLLWELMEWVIHVVARRFGFEPVLIAYGKRDTFFDLVFNLLGAVFVLLFGDRFLRNFTHQLDEGDP